MKTIIFDIDGTLTDLWTIERSVLISMLGTGSSMQIDKLKSSGTSNLYAIFNKCSPEKIDKSTFTQKYNNTFTVLLKENRLPSPKKYPLVKWIKNNARKYTYVYATGGQKAETLYVLSKLEIVQFFDIQNSVDKTTCRYSKKTGLPFRKILQKYPQAILITDSESDREGAAKFAIPTLIVSENTTTLDANI